MALSAPRPNSPVAWVPNMDMASPYQTFDPAVWGNSFDVSAVNQDIGNSLMFGSSGSNAAPVAVNAPMTPGAGTQRQPFFQGGLTVGPDGQLVQQAGFDFGWNAPSLQLGLAGLNTLSGLYFGNAAMRNAKDQLALAKTLGYANLNNQIASYNTNLKDKAAMRYDTSTEEGKARYDAYVNENQLSR